MIDLRPWMAARRRHGRSPDAVGSGPDRGPRPPFLPACAAALLCTASGVLPGPVPGVGAGEARAQTAGARTAGAQTPRSRSGAVTAIRAGRLLDVERGELLEERLILVEGERIVGVRPAAGGTPPGARVLDLSRYTVLPGLMDMHTHIVDRYEATGGPAAPLTQTGAEDAFDGVRNARATLMAGFTTVRDVGTWRALVDAALRDAIADGTVPGPRMLVAGAYVTVSSGGGEITGIAPDVRLPRELRFGVADSPDEVRRRVREILHGGADFIKVIATGAVLTEGTVPGAPEYTEGEIRAAVEEAANYGTWVAAHAHGAEGAKRAIRAGVRTIEHGSLLDDEAIRLMRERGTWLVADIWNADWIDSVGRAEGWSREILRKNEETAEAQREVFRKAVAAGVEVAYGTDAGVYPHGMNAAQLPYMVRHGMSPARALRSATLDAARLLGREEELGSLSPGKYADIIAVRGDPLADISALEDVAFVMKGGRVHRAPATAR